MATKRSVRLVDDLDGSPADEVISISWGHADYEIDLSAAHAAELRRVLAPYIAAGRRVRGTQPASRSRRAAGRGRDETADIRRWAREHDHKISDRGRIPSSVVKAWDDRGSVAAPAPVVEESLSVEEKPKRTRRPRKGKETVSAAS